MKVKAFLNVGYPAASREEVFEIDDGATDEEIEEEVKQWVFDHIDWYWEKGESGSGTN